MPKPTDQTTNSGGVTSDRKPGPTDEQPVRRRDDLTIRGADPKEVSPPPQMSEHLGKKTK